MRWAIDMGESFQIALSAMRANRGRGDPAVTEAARDRDLAVREGQRGDTDEAGRTVAPPPLLEIGEQMTDTARVVETLASIAR